MKTTGPASVAELALKQLGASVRAIATSSNEESDWMAVFEDCRLLVEEKTKFDNPTHQKSRHQALAAGEPFKSTLPLAPNNRLSGIVRKAARQLSSSGERFAHDFRILWFTAIGFDAKAKLLQLNSTLYGTTKVFQLGKPELVDCYFFHDSDFYRYPHIDGAVAASAVPEHGTVSARLLLNPHSQNHKAIRESVFGRKFQSGLLDPLAEEAAGRAYIVDCDMPRSNHDAILNYIQRKYRLEAANFMDMNLSSVVMSMPAGSLAPE